MNTIRISLIILALVLSACMPKPEVLEPNPHSQYFSKLDVHASVSEERAKGIEDPDHYLILLVDPIGVDYTSMPSMLTTMHKHPRGGKLSNAVGHSWIILGKGDDMLECGHSGEYGLQENTYYQGVTQLSLYGDPNPAAYLHEPMGDGMYVPNNAGHTPQTAIMFKITPEQYDAVYTYINNYDYKTFSMTGQQCTSFAAGAAKLIGVDLGHKVTIALPRKIRFDGTEYLLWTDMKYSQISYSAPGVFEKSLIKAVEKGYATDVLDWYLK